MDTTGNRQLSLSAISNPDIRVILSSSNPDISVELTQSPIIQWQSVINPGIRLEVHRPGKTPSFGGSPAMTVLSVPRGTEIGGWRLKSVLLVQLTHSRRESLATTWLEGVAEYGTAKGEGEAITDLITSLGEYLEALENREGNLGDSSRRELNCLRRLVERL